MVEAGLGQEFTGGSALGAVVLKSAMTRPGLSSRTRSTTPTDGGT